MSQNDKLLLEKGLPVLSEKEKEEIRNKWQSVTWDDMLTSLNSFGKYIMLRPTGFGKTFTCACACNIGFNSDESKNGEIKLNNGSVITNKRLASIVKKKVIFVYTSEILKNTFDTYNKSRVVTIDGKRVKQNELIRRDRNGGSRIIYETYSMLAGHWHDEEYLKEKMDIGNVGLVIFDEVQRMGAPETAKALEVALPILESLGIYYIGATATVERATGHDVCDKYFTYRHPDTNKVTYCWGEHIYTLAGAFKSGLIIPPEYQYIEENKSIIKKARQTRLSMLQELKIKVEGESSEEAIQSGLKSIQELEQAVIKNSSKIIHDTMLSLYDCDKELITEEETLNKAKDNSIARPENLPKYMRFLVFTPDRQSMSNNTKNMNTDEVFGGMVKQTYNDFHKAFGRYGYKVRTTIISSLNKTEKENVRLLSEHTVTEEDITSGRAALPEDMTIDLIFSINMLNVGYHVEHITGLIFKRWTGSNQIYYQQLGRCLSSTSNEIPVVFDFVKSIDSRGITAPLFTRESVNKNVTENADGTQNVLYTNLSGSKKKKGKEEKKINLAMDNEGNLVNPCDCNTIDAKYITVSMTSASVDDILQRQKVYIERKNANELFELAYKKYDSNVSIHGNKLVSDINGIVSLRSTYRLSIMESYVKELKGNEPDSINFKAFIEYLKETGKTLYVEYGVLKNYIDKRDKGEKLVNLGEEINSILVASSEGHTNKAKLVLLVNKENIKEFKGDTKILNELKGRNFNIKTDTVVYEVA